MEYGHAPLLVDIASHEHPWRCWGNGFGPPILLLASSGIVAQKNSLRLTFISDTLHVVIFVPFLAAASAGGR